jgi:hypothetical protein
MKDIESLEAMLTRAGIAFTLKGCKGLIGFPEARWEIQIDEGAGPRNIGHDGSSNMFYFDDSGTLVVMGAWG